MWDSSSDSGGFVGPVQVAAAPPTPPHSAFQPYRRTPSYHVHVVDEDYPSALPSSVDAGADGRGVAAGQDLFSTSERRRGRLCRAHARALL